MVQTNLKSDNFCGYNQSASPFHWIMDKEQVNVQFNSGEIGITTDVGLHVPSEVIGVSNYLSDRGNYLTKCVPPVPSILSDKGYEGDAGILGTENVLKTHDLCSVYNLKNENFSDDNGDNNDNNDNDNDNNDDNDNKLSTATGEVIDNKCSSTEWLLPNVFNNKRSAIDISGQNFKASFLGAEEENLPNLAQDLDKVIERMAPQRGGLDSNAMIKNFEEYNLSSKIRKPYDAKYCWFGFPFKDGELAYIYDNQDDLESKHFTPDDIVILGGDSPAYQQGCSFSNNDCYNCNDTYNNKAPYLNGGCNKISIFEDMCSDS